VLKAAIRIRLAAAFILCLFLGVAWSAEELPASLSHEAFWKLVIEFSEPGGSFVSDNFVSNELRLQNVLATLTEGRKPGGVYLGVGPEQNFTYIAALKPRIAFIFDIRRQNMIEHLTYKALFELAEDRIDFLARLFSRQRPPGVGKDSSIVEIFAALSAFAAEQGIFEHNVQAVKDLLIADHQFSLTSDDEVAISYILRAFFLAGPGLTYSGTRLPNARTLLPSYEDLMTDTDQNGEYRSFVATEELFQTVKQLEKNNLLIPVVGDFAGASAIQAVGAYLKEHDATVTGFYLSNVEQYLFMSDAWKKFYLNVSALPLDSRSVFIRPLINTGQGGYSSSPLFRSGFHWDTFLFSIQDLLAAFNGGMIQSYYDIIQMPN
jgi:hypothetical protein